MAEGPKLRIRLESFADHYSQARQFFVSQTPIERKHIGDALVFELSKVERVDIRARLVSHLINIDPVLAQTVADGLALDLPEPAIAARPTIQDLPPSDALSIITDGPPSLEGRKFGILLTDGSDAALFAALTKALDAQNAVFEVVAPAMFSHAQIVEDLITAGADIDCTDAAGNSAKSLACTQGNAAMTMLLEVASPPINLFNG